MLVHPAEWHITQGDLLGPDAVHRQLLDWLEALGLRSRTAVQGRLGAGAAIDWTDLAPRGEERDGATARLSSSRDG
jgi:hypothetical protein